MRRHKTKKTELPKLANQYNISYIDPNLPRPTVEHGVRHLVSAAVIYGVVLIIFSLSPHYMYFLSVTFYGVSAIKIYWYVYAAYLIIITPICIYIRPRSLWISNPVRITGYIIRFVRGKLKPSKAENSYDSLKPTYEEKHAIFFYIVKMIYGPIAINAAIDGFNRAVPIFRDLQLQNVSPANYFDIVFKFFITVAFMIEAIPYIISYHADSKLLGNKVRYVETKPFHLFVCLACYPPFNNATVAFLGGSFEDPFFLIWRGDINHPATWILRILAMIFAGILISASLTLFTRASNLTNRGIVTWGPYRIVRHPGYASKNIYWLLTFIPLIVSGNLSPLGYIMFLFGYISWATLYFLRGITEERFLMRDPDYVEYCKKVKYHFIPWIY
ncbi:MAG: isoprenylcysteine carboxylmethyltransferase family protein [Sedimentisphaerales bacterium]|nr:isoprenylcysteine carboxylmethyltransferase family protein [Sedimentisphaerales bacterium]